MEADILLRRVERTAVVLCAAMALAAFAIAGGRVRSALAVLGGGLLVSASYRMILMSAGVLAGAPARAAVHGATAGDGDGAAAPSRAARTPMLTGAKVAGRYALLAVLAYVMIARLRLPPLGLLAGASSIVAAVSVEALHVLLKKTP